ncbi:MAG TPA: DUF2927 domain-containing protein [Thermohalobaculum sp.]|nr:DUF2927 domain-containing protein [Thermohalobaculum sp.]
MRPDRRQPARGRVRAPWAPSALAAVAAVAAVLLAPAEARATPGGAAGAGAGVAASNASLAQVFTLLTHDMEWGGTRPHLVRFETPVAVGLEGPGAARFADFVDGYLDRLRRRSGIDIARRRHGQNLHVRFVGRSFERTAPGISCFVVAGDVAWKRFAADPRGHDGRRLAEARAIGHMTVFIPAAAPAHRVRSCLVEEIAQALGPANDLYGLGPTIFNDDDAHFWPTELDHLMLRVLYSDALRTGMDRATTERAARQVLDRINPAGLAAPALPLPQQRRMADWRQRLQGAFEPGLDARAAARRAAEAASIAAARTPGSAYHCHSMVALAQLAERGAAARPLEALDAADAVCRRAHGAGDIRLAWIGLMRAQLMLDLRRHGEAAELAGQVLPAFLASGQTEPAAAARKAQDAALSALGRHPEARAMGRAAGVLRSLRLAGGRAAVPATAGSAFARQR